MAIKKKKSILPHYLWLLTHRTKLEGSWGVLTHPHSLECMVKQVHQELLASSLEAMLARMMVLHPQMKPIATTETGMINELNNLN